MKRENNVNGELPSGYTRLQYIESTGTQYIDTGVSNLNTGFRIDTKMDTSSYTSGTGWIFYFAIEEDGEPYRGLKFRYRYDKHRNINIYGLSEYTFANDSGLIDLSMNVNSVNSTISVDGVEVFNENTPSFNIPSISLPIFTCRTGSRIVSTAYSRAKLYYMSIYINNGVDIVRNFIPALRNSDSKPGLYDTVNGVFYTNQGTGEFLYA